MVEINEPETEVPVFWKSPIGELVTINGSLGDTGFLVWSSHEPGDNFSVGITDVVYRFTSLKDEDEEVCQFQINASKGKYDLVEVGTISYLKIFHFLEIIKGIYTLYHVTSGAAYNNNSRGQ